MAYGPILLIFFFSNLGWSHYIKATDNNSKNFKTLSMDVSFDNAKLISDDDVYIDGGGLFSRSESKVDSSITDFRLFKIGFITSNEWSLNLESGQLDNIDQELTTKINGLEVGKRFFISSLRQDDSNFTPDFCLKLKLEKTGYSQSQTFKIRKFDFSFEQTGTSLYISSKPIYWFSLYAKLTKYRYNQNVESVIEKTKTYPFLSSLFNNIQMTISSLAEQSKTIGFNFFILKDFELSLTRTYSEDLISNVQFNTNTLDFGSYYFNSLYIFVTVGENYNGADASKTAFTELSLQYNF